MNKKSHKLKIDERGRVCIPADVRKKYGNNYKVAVLGNRLEFIPEDEAQIDREWLEYSGVPLIFEFTIDSSDTRDFIPKNIREDLPTEFEVSDQDGKIVLNPL